MVAVAAIGVLAAPAYAQQLNSGATGSAGQVRLRANFQPDPHTVSVSAGGVFDSSTLGDGCRGYMDTRASYTLRYNAGDLPLYIGATSDADTTIAVRGPNGQWTCDDDSGGNLNPVVSWETPASGRYQIWVGRFGVQGESAAATLYITEVAPAPQQEAGGTPDWTLDPTFGEIALAAGFIPDPHTVEIAAGGSLDASVTVNEQCRGWIAAAPDYRVQWTAGSGQSPLIFSVASDADTTLVINDSQGNWVCDDDGGENGFNPSISFSNPPSGQYDVWVGTYSSGDLQESVLHVSEVDTQ